jgi:hypothetical protein
MHAADHSSKRNNPIIILVDVRVYHEIDQPWCVFTAVIALNIYSFFMCCDSFSVIEQCSQNIASRMN